MDDENDQITDTEPVELEPITTETPDTETTTTETTATEPTTSKAATIEPTKDSSSKPITTRTKSGKAKLKNKMREISIDKVVINIGVGEAGDKLIRAEKVIELLTHRKPIQTISRTTNRDLGIRKFMPIGCKITLRKDDAEKFLKDAFWVKENRIPGYSFDQEGNFSFGIPDYTDFPDMKYDPEIGIFGMDISVTMKRYGYHISRRKLNRRKIPTKTRITPGEVKEYVKSQFNIEVIE
jgi:large subunit ribosomal protein L5